MLDRMETPTQRQSRYLQSTQRQAPNETGFSATQELTDSLSLEDNRNDEKTTQRPTNIGAAVVIVPRLIAPMDTQALEEESVITEFSVEGLSIEEGGNYILEDPTQLPLTHIKILGQGYSAIVEKVKDTKTGRVFAKKMIKFPQARLRAQKEEHFTNEISIIRSLRKHHHIIYIFATYVAKREFGMFLQPAADEGSLEDYLDVYGEMIEDTKREQSVMDAKISVLEKAFGCLAAGLAYIHAKGIRHKDIKPKNILIHCGSVIYTDFGSSKDATQPGESTTEGQPAFLTKKYSAPEVIAHTKRNFGADIYSLGCVYIELLSALNPAFRYDRDKPFSDIMEYVHHELRSAAVPSRWSFIPPIIINMTTSMREDRPVAGEIFGNFSEYPGFCCAECHRKPKPKQEYTPWVWSSDHSRHYCYLIDEDGHAIGHIWSSCVTSPSAPAVIVYPSSGSRYVNRRLFHGYITLKVHISCDTRPRDQVQN